MWFAYNCCINFCQFSPFIYRLCEQKSFFFLFLVQEINIHVGLASKTQVSYFISKIDSDKTVLMRRIV